jgi:hypothetical protein
MMRLYLLLGILFLLAFAVVPSIMMPPEKMIPFAVGEP